VWQERKVRLTYERGECEATERLVDPLGLVAKGSVWYFVAGVEGGEVRSYRVSRVSRAELTDEPSTRPADFDLATFWEQSAAKFRAHLPSYRARVRVRREAVKLLPFAGRFARIEEVGEPDADGWAEVSLRFDVEEMACAYALGFGTQLEVLEPESLREKVCAAARGVVAFYGRKGSDGSLTEDEEPPG
jgi:predicted DNA-binding transcriptional regulator YafY